MSQHANSNPCGHVVPLSPVSARIATAERELQGLHRERAGQMEPGRGSGWCSECGRHPVGPLTSEDTYRDCVGALAVDSCGRSVRPGTFMDDLLASERARNARLRRLWQMSPPQRIAAMRRGELTRDELAAWSARHPEQVPLLNGEWEWIASKMPEACE
jgi:hypothetical protein